MSKVLRIALAIATLLTGSAMAYGAVWGIAKGIPIMVIVCGLLTAGFGLFIYHDYQYFFGKQDK